MGWPIWSLVLFWWLENVTLTHSPVSLDQIIHTLNIFSCLLEILASVALLKDFRGFTSCIIVFSSTGPFTSANIYAIVFPIFKAKQSKNPWHHIPFICCPILYCPLSQIFINLFLNIWIFVGSTCLIISWTHPVFCLHLSTKVTFVKVTNNLHSYKSKLQSSSS